jgi:hypothetical protein
MEKQDNNTISFKVISSTGPEVHKVTKQRFEVSVPKSVVDLADNKFGIEETNDFVEALCEAGSLYREVYQDGKLNFNDSLILVKRGPALVSAGIKAVVGFGKIGDELADTITDEEVAVLKTTVLKAKVLEGDAESAVLDAIDIGLSIKKWIFKYILKKK